MDRLKPRCPNCPEPLSHTLKTLITTGSNHPKRTLGTPRLSHTPKKVNKHGGFVDCPTVPYIHKRVGQTPPSYEWMYRLGQVTTLCQKRRTIPERPRNDRTTRGWQSETIESKWEAPE